MSEATAVSIVILNWNGLPHVLRCLEMVLASDYLSLSIILVDNGSTDGSVEVLRNRFPGVTLLSAATNLGYAAGNNLGIREAMRIGAPYVLFLNNDTEVAPDMVSKLVAALDDNTRAGIASPKIYLPGLPPRLWAVGGVFRDRRVITWGINETDSKEKTYKELDFVFGCAMMVRSGVLQQIGWFDVSYGFFFEDIDLCLRAKQAGYQVIWAPGAITWHLNPMETQRTSPFKLYNYERSRSLFYRRHLVGAERAKFTLTQIAHVVRIAGQHLIRGRVSAGYWSTAGAIAGMFADNLRERRPEETINETALLR